MTKDWQSYLWYELSFWACKAALTFGFSLRVEGSRNIPAAGPALIIANHQSFLDPVIAGMASRRHLHFLARKTLFRRKAFAWLISSLNAVPVNQDGIGIEGLRTVAQQLQQGHAVLVFPEGERTHTGPMQPLKPGVLLLIKRCSAPIVPVGVAGAYDAWPRWRRYPRLAPLCAPAGKATLAVSVGPPIDPFSINQLARERALEELFKKLSMQQQRAERLRRK